MISLTFTFWFRAVSQEAFRNCKRVAGRFWTCQSAYAAVVGIGFQVLALTVAALPQIDLVDSLRTLYSAVTTVVHVVEKVLANPTATCQSRSASVSARTAVALVRPYVDA